MAENSTMTAGPALSDVQRRMLAAGAFDVDGYTSSRGRAAVADLTTGV